MQPEEEKPTLTESKRGAQVSQRYLDRGNVGVYKPGYKRGEGW